MNRWENSIYWARTFSPLLQPGIIRIGRFDFTATQMLTIGTNPLTVFQGITGYTYYISYGCLYKQAGPAFTTAGQFFQVQYANTPPTAALNIATTSVLDQTVETPIIFSNTLPSFNQIADELISHVGGKAIRVTTSTGANFGGTGSPCTIFFGYYILPTLLSNLGGPTTTLP